MVMPIVEAVLQELVNAEEEREVISTAGSTIIEENEPIGICQCWPFFSHLFFSDQTRRYTLFKFYRGQSCLTCTAKDLVHPLSFCTLIFLSENER